MAKSVTGRAAALALALLAVLLPYAAVVAPLRAAHAARQAEIAALEERAARLAGLAAARDEWTRRRDAVAARRATLLLDGASEALVAAGLQNLVKAAVARSGGELRSTQALAVSEDKGFRRIAVRALLVTDPDGLRALLHAVESAAPPLFVDALEVRARANAETAIRLDVRLDVFGFAGGE